ncbi:MAG TPA: PhzF family phenazine biosynthesis protein [Anaerolineales bacterium]|nr:PhzF family phenazine biosynthesis protein [Anaerolineales bacterium]
MGIPFFQVDAFTDQPFRGNPAAVCLLPGPRDEVWMRDVARETNLSETAFVYREGEGFRLRWFTPAVEVDLCGHATLATAHVLWEVGWLAPEEPARFHTRSGLLTARRRGAEVELDFPALPEEPVDALPGLSEALGAAAVYVGRSEYDYLVEVASEEVVRGIKPDFNRLKTLSARGFIVTSRATSEGYDFVSRYFAPSVGVDEDPVTGSAHCCLGPFWGERLGKEEMVGYQASARGGVVRVRLAGERVYIGGRAVTVLEGELIAS